MDYHRQLHVRMANAFKLCCLQYNGCTWKGGKLRLEKAKEHYLVRLKREWAEDVKVNGPPDLDVVKSLDHSDKSGCLSQENANLRIFFPKLRKVCYYVFVLRKSENLHMICRLHCIKFNNLFGYFVK